MAVQGYSRAFDLVIDRVRTPTAPSIDETLILDLYVELSRPSVDAGIVTEVDLRRLENHQRRSRRWLAPLAARARKDPKPDRRVS